MRIIVVLVFGLSFAAAAWLPLGPDGGYVQAFALDPQDSQTEYAVSYDYPDNARVFCTTDGGTSWSLAGRVPNYYVNTVVVDVFNSTVLYAGSGSNVLYRSTDRGATWASSTLPGYTTDFDRDDQVEGRVYAAGYYLYNSEYHAALFISTNRGLTWSVSMPRPDTVFYGYACAAAPGYPGRVYLGCNNGYLYETTDAGTSWTLANSGIPPTASVSGLSISLLGPVLAATSSGIYRSADGINWALATGSPTGASSVDFGHPGGSTAWCLGRADSIRVYVSTDIGATWRCPSPGFATSKVASLHPWFFGDMTAFANTQIGIFRSTDMGANWQAAHSGLRIAKISTIAAGPWNSERVYLEVAENGVFKSANRGLDWTRCNDFLSCGNICGIGVQPGTDGDILYALEGSG